MNRLLYPWSFVNVDVPLECLRRPSGLKFNLLSLSRLPGAMGHWSELQELSPAATAYAVLCAGPELPSLALCNASSTLCAVSCVRASELVSGYTASNRIRCWTYGPASWSNVLVCVLLSRAQPHSIKVGRL